MRGLKGDIGNIRYNSSYSAGGRRELGSEEFKRYFYARRRMNRSSSDVGSETSPSSKANVACSDVKRNSTVPSRAASQGGARTGKDAGRSIVERLGVVVRKKDIVGITERAAKEWLDIDQRERRAEGEKKKMPVTTMVAILTIALSLLLVVAGTVITSQASTELYAAEARFREATEVKEELERKIEIKNDLKYIEMMARTRLGMVDREFAAVKYIGGESEEKVVIYNNDGDRKFGLSTLLSALGFPG